MAIKYQEKLCKSILHRINKPSLPFDWGANPYRGCIHSCIYCFARYTHSYLDLDPKSDFETTIIVKNNAPMILRKELSNPKWKKEHINLGSVCDPYQIAEKNYEITREMLKIFNLFKNPLTIATKSDLILRDIDILKQMHKDSYLNIVLSLSSIDENIRKELEPRTITTKKRLEAIKTLHEAGLKVGVLLMPIAPYLNDSKEKIEQLISEIAKAGTDFVIPGILYLYGATKKRFFEYIDQEHKELLDDYKRLYEKGFLRRDYKTEMQTFLRTMVKKYSLNNYNTLPKKLETQKSLDQWIIE